MRSTHIFLIFLMFALVGCETVVDIDLPDTESKLTLNCLFSPDSTIKVYVTTSKSYVDPGSITVLGNAVVELTGTDGTSETLTQTNYLDFFSFQESYQFQVKAKAEVEYSIVVSAAGYPAASARATLPEKIAIQELDTSSTVANGYRENQFSVWFSDPSNSINYYEIAVFNLRFLGEQIDGQFYFFPCESPAYAYPSSQDVFGGGSVGLFFDDELFNGREYSVKANYSAGLATCLFDEFEKDTNDYSEYVIVELRHLSEDYFKFVKSYNLNAGSGGDPFAQPGNVYENVDNGHGIFAGFNLERDTFLIKKGTFPSPLD
jgi:hypothetical protein